MISRRKVMLSLLTGLVLAFTACAPLSPGIPVTGQTSTAPASGITPVLPPKAVLDAQEWLAAQLNMAANQILIMDVEQVEWTDSCLGLGRLNESCLQAITPGWRVTFQVNGVMYEVRTDETAATIRLAPSEGASEDNLEGTHWRLLSFGSLNDGQAVIEGSSVTLMMANGQAGGYGGCNSYGGTYQVEGNTISFAEITRTEMACADEAVTEQESRYFEALQSADHFERMDNLLIFSDESGDEVLTFETPIIALASPGAPQ